ncbi:hypothetical protein SDJN02_12255, partial [Cucurbita argyrosperma subsp. argyrosperma]
MNTGKLAFNAMKNLATLFFFLCGLALSLDLGVKETPACNHERHDEVEKHCKSVLSSAAELSSDTLRFTRMKEQLQFVNGDWWQDGGKYPLLPFKNGCRVFSVNRFYSNPNFIPLKLISFWVTDIDLVHQTKRAVGVSGLVSMGITTDTSFDYCSSQHPHFKFWPGRSELILSFQGIYTESKKNGGERVLCLLGRGTLPARDQESGDPWHWAKDLNVNHHQLPLLQDDKVLLVLRYPMKNSLTSRVIQGEMRSLNMKSNDKYFDDIHILSQLGDMNYDFASEKVVDKACGSYSYNDKLIKKNISMHRGSYFCEVLQEITRDQAFTILPNWRCNSTDEFCRKLGPFISVINSTDESFNDVGLYMQDVKCKTLGSNKNGFSVSVSAVFRAVLLSENRHAAWRRSALNNMTMVSEGIWNSSSGQLYMVGCVGLVDAEKISCDSRICLYIPILFTLEQRRILVGSISSVDDKPLYSPLSFEKLLRPTELWSQFRNSQPFYSYTKIASALAVLEKYEPFGFRTVAKKSLLHYLKWEDTETYELSESLLLEDLTLNVPALGSQASGFHVQMEIISVGSFFVWDLSRLNGANSDTEASYHVKPEVTEKKLLVNVSALLALSEQTSSNFSALSVEGIFDPLVRKMYLIGCRDIRSSPSWRVLHETMDLEDGLDCLIEVIVSYPPTTAPWFINPSAVISISSQRTEDDPFYFSPIKLETMPIMYRRQRQYILSRKIVEVILQILTLSVANACILSQIFYMNDKRESVPYISLVTLGVQSLGYSLPLVTRAEAHFIQRGSISYNESYDLGNNLWFIVKLQVVISLLLTLRLCQKVSKSRIKLLRQAPLELHRVPSDKSVLIATFLIHLVGYVAVPIVHTSRTAEMRVKSSMIPSRTSGSHMVQGWEKDLQEYVGLVQDLFLLPQVIGNLLWKIDCKPLRKFYFIGITLARLLPHIYDFVNPSMDFYSTFGDIAILLIAFILAVIVYVQQQLNYEKLSRALIVGQVRLLPRASKMYQRSPSKSL